MNTETILLITAPQDYLSRFDTESLGLSLVDGVKKFGGAAWAGWLESGTLKVRIQKVSDETIQQMMGAYFTSAAEGAKSVSVVEQQAEETTLPDIAAGDIPWGTVIREKLTKKLLKRLPEGAYLSSNLYQGGEEIFSEPLGASNTRETTWQRAVKAGASNRLCRLLWIKSDFEGMRLPDHAPLASR